MAENADGCAGFFGHDKSEPRRGCILFLDDQDDFRALVIRELVQEGWDVYAYGSADKATKALDDQGLWDEIDIAVLDYDLRSSTTNGLKFAEIVFERGREQILSVIFTAEGKFITHDELLEAQSTGRIRKYFEKGGLRMSAVIEELKRFQNEQTVRRNDREVQRKQEQASRQGFDEEIYGEELIHTDQRILRYVGPSLMNVLILGDTGTGKEQMAKRIHVASHLPGTDSTDGSERYQNFRVLNCAGLNDELLVSHLFGHVQGAFTSAVSHHLGAVLEAVGLRHYEYEQKDREPFDKWLLQCVKKGLRKERVCAADMKPDKDGYITFPPFEARGPRGYCGTLFLDEVGELSAYAQAALLRFLDNNGIQPLGYCGTAIRPKVRIIAATNRSKLLFGGDDRAFREDLLWRLMEWVIKMPPISQRGAEPIRVARDVARKLHTRPIELDGEALVELEEMIEGGADGESRFSGSTPATSGNYRSLKALIKRATWIAATSGRASPMITLEVLKEAAQDYVDLAGPGQSEGTASAKSDSEGVSSLKELKETVVRAAAYLKPKGKQGPAPFFNGDDDFKNDLTLAWAIRNLLCHEGHGIDQLGLFKTPGDELGSSLGFRSCDRWKNLCVLAILAAGHHEGTETAYQRAPLNDIWEQVESRSPQVDDSPKSRETVWHRNHMVCGTSWRTCGGIRSAFLRLSAVHP